MMSGTAVVVGLLLMMAGPSLGPDLMIAKLGASRYADREAAAQGLEKLGREAIPALKRAKTHRDSEIRTRAEALLVKIEGRLLLEPSKVQLAFQDQPLPDVVRNINGKSGTVLTLLPEDRGQDPSRRVTLNAPEPVPFWTAVDRLCEVGTLQYSSAPRQTIGVADRSLQLSSGSARTPGMIHDSGPFRFSLLSLHYQRDLTFGPQLQASAMAGMAGVKAEAQVPSEQFYLRLQVAAEPSLYVAQHRPAKVLVATDDLGQSMVVPAAIEGTQFQGDFFATGSGVVPFQLQLKRPARAGKLIHELRGVIALNISARKADRLEVSLADSAGKTFKNDDARMTIHEIKPHPNTGQSMVELSVAVLGLRNEQPPDNDLFMAQRPDIGPMNLELLDAQDNPISWYLAGTHQNGDDTRVSLAIVQSPTGVIPKPAKVRYYALIRTTSEIGFSFKDVPMP